MQDEKGKTELLTTKINSSILYELGGMYTTVSQTLREFTQNAFDSCANNVYINIDIINDTITITDDGIGMNDYVVRNHYKDVGFSTKNKKEILGADADDSDKMPKVPSELVHNLKRPKIGSKGMGKLSWILLADKMETITTTVDMGDSIKLEFSADDLENNKLSHVSKNEIENGHGTILKMKGLKIKDFGRYNKSENNKNSSSSSSSDLGSDEIEELTNTVGFLGVAFPDFHMYLSVNSVKERITKQLIIKKFYSGKSVRTRESGIFNYIDCKVDYKTVGGSKKVPYDFMLIIPDKNSGGLGSGSSSSEFWLLSQYMGITKLTGVKGLSGYLNIDNVKLVANRNDLQASEKDLFRELKDKICDKLAEDMVAVYRSGNVDSGISILDQNQNDLLEFVYHFSKSYRQLTMIIPYLKFKFYLDGEHRLGDFVGKEQAIYYYFSNDDNNAIIADKASYCGYKCFEIMNESNVINTLDNAYTIKDYIQSIGKLPSEAYESAGSSVTPIGGLKDVLGNLGPIFDSLAFAMVKMESNISRLKNELSTKKFSVVQRKERQKEINKLEKYLLNLKYSRDVSGGMSSDGKSSDGKSSGNVSSANVSNIGKGADKGGLKLSSEHYVKYNMLDREYLIGFASLEDEATIASITNKIFITFNLKNEYIKDALDERNPIRQVILLLPLICHEICHEFSSTHDEVFQMMFNALLIPSLDHLTKQIFMGDLKVKAVEDICINDKGEKQEKGFYHGKPVCSICRLLLATPETIKTGVCSKCAKKIKRNENKK